MVQDNVLHDSQPQARAPGFAGAGFIGAVEALEYARQMLGCDSRAEVAYVKLQLLARFFRAEQYASTGGSIFHRIFDEVCEDLLDRVRISADVLSRGALDFQLFAVRG